MKKSIDGTSDHVKSIDLVDVNDNNKAFIDDKILLSLPIAKMSDSFSELGDFQTEKSRHEVIQSSIEAKEREITKNFIYFTLLACTNQALNYVVISYASSLLG